MWILLAFSVYLGYAFLDRRAEYLDAVATWEEATLAWHFECGNAAEQQFCPAREITGDQPESPDDIWSIATRDAASRIRPTDPPSEFESHFGKNYAMPGFGLIVAGNVLLIGGLVALFLITLVYWSYLRRSIQSHRSFAASQRSVRKIPVLWHPWLYDLPLGSARAKTVWQISLELLPVAVLVGATAVAEWSLGNKYAWVVTGSMIAIALTMLHSRMFDVPVSYIFRQLDAFQVCAFAAVAIAWILVETRLINPTLPTSDYPLLGMYVSVLIFVIFLDLCFQSDLYWTSIIGLPVYAFRSMLSLLPKRGRLHMKKFWRGYYSELRRGPKAGGYITYFRRRYRELKDLERGSQPPPNPLLPNDE